MNFLFFSVIVAVHLQKPPMVHAGAQNLAALQQQIAQQPPSIASGNFTHTHTHTNTQTHTHTRVMSCYSFMVSFNWLIHCVKNSVTSYVVRCVLFIRSLSRCIGRRSSLAGGVIDSFHFNHWHFQKITMDAFKMWDVGLYCLWSIYEAFEWNNGQSGSELKPRSAPSGGFVLPFLFFSH